MWLGVRNSRMNRKLFSLALALGFAASHVIAQDDQHPPMPENGGGAPRMHLLPRGAEDALQLTGEQRRQVAALEAESRTKLESILTPEQMQKLAMLRPPQNRRGENASPPPTRVDTESKSPPAGAVAPTLPAGVTRQPVVFSGGHDTVPVDHGRPVVLIAAALGVQDEVFREAFRHVHPAGPNSGGPTDAEARANKAALMGALGKYGVTDERLNTVSNFYRYPPGSRSLWRNKPATANALVKDGAIVSFEITDGGYGYTTLPTVTVPGFESAAMKVALSYGKDFETNGAVTTITLSLLH